jgi:serine/threonine protein kinase
MNRIGRYQIEATIGMGGMGTVYRALDQEMERLVALKLLPKQLSSDATFAGRFRREAQIVARLEHPHIVPIYDVGEHDGQPFLVMRLLTGGTFRERINRSGTDLKSLLPILDQLADALEAAHSRHIIHRDIKPSNILFDDRGTAFLSDFGVAKVLDATTQLTQSGLMGTAAYMSPEQFTGVEIDGRSDQYALAVMVFEALAGQLPFTGDTVQIMYKHLEVIPPHLHDVNPACTPAVSHVLNVALAKKPDERYPSIKSFVAALRTAADTPATAVMAAPPPPRPATVDPPTPGHLGHYYKQGLEAMSQSDWPAALVAFDQVLALDPRYRNAATLRQQVERRVRKRQTSPRPPRPEGETPAAGPSPVPLRATLPERKTPPGGGQPLPIRSVTPSAPTVQGEKPWYKRPAILIIPAVVLVVALLAFIWIRSDEEPITQVENTPEPTVELSDEPESAAAATLPQPESNPTIFIVEAGRGATAQQLQQPAETIETGDALVGLSGLSLQSGEASLTLRLLADTQLILAPASEIELNRLADPATGQGESQLTLQSGHLLLISPAESEPNLIIESPLGASAASQGGLMGIEWVTGRNTFTLDCFTGPCLLVDIGGAVEIVTGQAGRVSGNGIPTTLASTRHELYHLLTTAVPSPTASLTPLPTGTDNPTATPGQTTTARPATTTPTRPPATPTRPPDRDGDGVPDGSDGCPDEPGTIGNGGCPRPTDTPPPPPPTPTNTPIPYPYPYP